MYDNNSDLVLNDNVSVTGNLYDGGGDLVLNDNVIVTGTLYDNGGDLVLGDNVIVTGNLYDSGSDLVLNDNVVITGNLYDSNSDLVLNDNVDVNGDMDVDGDIVADAITLNVGSFPDYVFEAGYDLMSLKDVESFINANKRLPKMPSEAEVLAHGMNAAQVNVLLVEKVEELTLHTIEQEKEIEALKATLNKVLERLEDQ